MQRRQSPVPEISLQTDLHCSVEDQRRLLGASPFFRKLDDAEVDEVQRAFQQQHHDAGDVIQAAGEPARRLSIVAAGTVKLVRPTPDGQDVLLDLLGPGEHFGSLAELGDAVYREDVTAHTACCILFTTAESFNRLLARFPVVALATLEIVAGRLRNAHSAIEHLSAYPVEHRVAAILLQLAEKRGTQSDHGLLIEIPLSRQDVADMTGAKVETVSRVMSEFRRMNLIKSGRRWISVLDEDGLREIVE
jgi:CRP/FNR family transcriptional regulator, nitrogen oxide reductase regulator